MRTCVGCRRRTVQEELVRLARSPDGSLVIDRGRRAVGRGAYVCSDVRCFEQAVAKGRLARALRGPVEVDVAGLSKSFVEEMNA